MVEASDAAAEAVGGILIDAAVINSDRGATTTVKLSSDSLSPTSISATTVTFGGSVTVTTTISGPKGSGTSADTVSGPVTVRNEQGSWKVSSFTYDGAPVTYWPESTGETVDGLTVQVGYVVSYGSLTAALVTLGSPSGNVNVTYQSTSLVTPAGSSAGTGDFTSGSSPTGVLRFSRTDATPTELDMAFTNSSGQQMAFTVPLHGSAS